MLVCQQNPETTEKKKTPEEGARNKQKEQPGSGYVPSATLFSCLGALVVKNPGSEGVHARKL